MRCPTLLLFLATGLAAAESAAYGSKDFYPSAEWSIGVRADGNGHYPGATPVTEWWDAPATVVEAQEKGKPVKVVVPGAGPAKNIVWKVPALGTSDAHPIVIGDLIVGIAEPDWVFCLDAHTGKTLWQDRLAPLSCDPVPDAWQKKQEICDLARATGYLFGGLNEVDVTKNTALVEKALVWLKQKKARAAELDNNAAIQQGFDKAIAEMTAFLSGEKKSFSTMNWMVEFVVKPVEQAYQLSINNNWYGHVNLAASTPVSDGESVYAIFAQRQVACYDLNGKRRWARRFEAKGRSKGPGVDHWPSPFLCGTVLIVRNYDGFGGLMGLDKATGTTIWHNTFDKLSYNFQHPQVMRLNVATGGTLDIVVSQWDLIIRVEDGKVVGKLPQSDNPKDGNHLYGTGSKRLSWNNHLLMDWNDTSNPARVFRLVAPSRDEVTLEQVADLETPDKKSPFPQGVVTLTADGIAMDGSGGSFRTWNVRTGKQLGSLKLPMRSICAGTAIGPLWLTVAGGTNFPGNSHYGRQLPDGSAAGQFAVVDISDPKQPRLLTDRNVLGSPDLPNDLIYDQYMTEIGPKHHFMGCYNGIAGWWGLRNSGVAACGNRMFLQSATHVYCLGDPAVQYDWNPATRPAAITARLAAAAQ